MRLPFRGYDDLDAMPHVVVDGTATDGTTLTLSHWPGSPVLPEDLQADLSAQMAFCYLDRSGALHGDAEAVTNNHFDQDGLVSIFALSRPEEAQARRTILEDLAAAGDFATFRDRDAARASMVVSAFTDPDRSPFGPLPDTYSELTAFLYTETLGRLTELVDHVDRYRGLWEEEDARLAESQAAIDGGSVRIDERPGVDLAVVSIDDGHDSWGHRFGGRRFDGVHPMALHAATDANSILLVTPGSFRFTYRYESWVTYRSRPIRRRVDLQPLASALTAADTVQWSADPVTDLTPALGPAGSQGSSLSPAVVEDLVVEHLRTAPPAFDPFAPRTW